MHLMGLADRIPRGSPVECPDGNRSPLIPGNRLESESASERRLNDAATNGHESHRRINASIVADRCCGRHVKGNEDVRRWDRPKGLSTRDKGEI